MRRAVCVMAVAMVMATASVDSNEVCTGRRSLVRDPKDETKAQVLAADCNATSFSVSTGEKGAALDVVGQQIQEIVSYPSVVSLNLDKNSIAPFNFSVDTVLQYLQLSDNKLTTLDEYAFPPQLQYLNLSFNSISSVQKFKVPKSLRTLDLSGCSFTSLRGLRVTESLQSLVLTGNKLTEIEVRESDVEFFKGAGASLPPITTAKCGSASAKIVAANNTSLCVISDSVFDQLYAVAGQAPAAPAAPSSSDSQDKILLVVLGVGSVMLLAVLCIGYRVFKGNWDVKTSTGAGRRRNRGGRHHANDSAKSSGKEPLTSNTGDRPFGFPMEYFEDDDVRYDAELTQYRIAKDHLDKKKVLAKGGFGVVYLAKYQGMNVAVKQLQRDKMRYSTMQHFMKEIRLCASLNHPNIVGFLGVSWSTLHDLAVVIEYMPRGDLYSFLRHQRKKSAQPSRPKGKRAQVDFEWFRTTPEPVPPEVGAIPTKASIAVDVADALMYLHGHETPIIHRDLKSKNVLLADDFNAKISDFGISRMQDLEETMTREVGTVAWIAPEVLKGARYTEKADIYSFGVLLTELDTCHLPYTIGFGSDKQKRTNTWIASMVSAGVLQPVLLDSCPANVRELALECMQFDADIRPSAADILKRLKTMIVETEPRVSYVRL